MNKYWSVALCGIILFLAGCHSGRVAQNSVTYNSPAGYKNFYVLDTVYIKNPIVVYTWQKHMLLMSKDELEEDNGRKEFFLWRTNVFFYEKDFSRLLPEAVYSNYSPVVKGAYCGGELKENKKLAKGYIRNVWEFEKVPDYFLLALVKGSYFNEIYAGEKGGTTHLNFEDTDFSYFRVAVPFCF